MNNTTFTFTYRVKNNRPISPSNLYHDFTRTTQSVVTLVDWVHMARDNRFKYGISVSGKNAKDYAWMERKLG